MTVPQLWQPGVTAGLREVAEAIVGLRDQQALSFPQISDVLNQRNVTSPQGRAFYPQLVYSIYRNWVRRTVLQAKAPKLQLVDIGLVDASQFGSPPDPAEGGLQNIGF